MRTATILFVLIGIGLFGCGKPDETHSESIPDIPPGRSSMGTEAGDPVPVAPPER